MGPSIQQRWIRPAGERLGIQGVGFHTFRHSYKSWLDSVGTPMGAMKDLMRHSAISVTMNIYGDTLTPEKRLHNDAVALLLYPRKRSAKRKSSR
jgi:integrase